MLVGCLALAGFPFLQRVLLQGRNRRRRVGPAACVLGVVMLLTAFLTAYYTFRLYFRVFEGPLVLPEAPAGGHGHGHSHERPRPRHRQRSAVHAGDPHESGVDKHLPRIAHARTHGHGDDHHNHEPLSMMLPLVVLAIGAVARRIPQLPERNRLGEFLGKARRFVRGVLSRRTTRPGDIDPRPVRPDDEAERTGRAITCTHR